MIQFYIYWISTKICSFRVLKKFPNFQHFFLSFRDKTEHTRILINRMVQRIDHVLLSSSFFFSFLVEAVLFQLLKIIWAKFLPYTDDSCHDFAINFLHKVSTGLEEAQVGIKIARRNISNLRYADDTTLTQKMKN